jgi:iron complex transport system substrate-binding protein
LRRPVRFITLWLIVLLTLAACGASSGPQTPGITPVLIPPPTGTPQPPPVDATVPALDPTVSAAADVAGGFPLSIADAAGRKVTIAKAPQRIVSLAPSTTEILFALGLGGKVVAVDNFSDYPADVTALPKIGDLKVNFEQVVAKSPDLVLAAAITSPDAVKKLEDLKLTVVVVGSATSTMDNIQSDITLVGKVSGTQAQAQQVIEGMRKKLDSLKAKAATARSKPRVYWELDGTDPTKPFTVGPGGFVNDIITLAGGENTFAKSTTPYAQISSEQVVSANPDIIIMSDAAYGVTVDALKARKGWNVVNAVKNNKVFPIDDNLVSRPGPRVVDGLEAAMRLIHPELFQ